MWRRKSSNRQETSLPRDLGEIAIQKPGSSHPPGREQRQRTPGLCTKQAQVTSGEGHTPDLDVIERSHRLIVVRCRSLSFLQQLLFLRQ